MTRPWRVALLLALMASAAPARVIGQGQAASVLHIKVTLVDAEQKPRPVARHALLISDNPMTRAPRLVVTGADGSVDVRLRPGSYTVESDRPVPFLGKAYTWTQEVTIGPGRDAVLELNAANAVVESAGIAAAEVDLESMFEQWQDSVVTVWSETSYGLGFVLDAKGLVATAQRVVGPSTSAEVEITPGMKVPARVVSAGSQRTIAILWVDPKAIASIRPVRPSYAQDERAPVAAGQRVFSVGAALHGTKYMTTATVRSVEARAIDSDLIVDRGNAGAPVFAADGGVIGMTTLGSARDDRGPGVSGAVRIDEARDAIADAESKMRGLDPPLGTRLPIEPSRPFAAEALKAAVQGRNRNVIDYQLKGADFDVTFITPLLIYGVQYRAEQAEARTRGTRTRSAPSRDPLLSLDSFENWADYAGNFPPVLMIRVTPRLVEGFLSVLGRQAARTQGINLPSAAKHVKAGFSSMRVFCGDTEVAPIHPFRIERRVTIGADAKSTDAVVYEGLYVIDPNALGPACGTVKVVLFSTKDPNRGDARLVPAGMLQQIWDDFGGWRSGVAAR